MKILYGIQGTGHGHLSRAKELLPELGKHAAVDVLISGYASQLDLEGDVRYRKHGISLAYDRNGGVSILETLKSLKPIRFISDVQSMPLGKYDLVVSDYEPVSSWAAKLADVPSVAVSHQAAFLSGNTPRPGDREVVAEAILEHFAPADRAIGFHFRRYDDFIEPPIIRSEIQALSPFEGDHITVYLPAHHHERLSDIFNSFKDISWHIFSPSCKKFSKKGHISVFPISNTQFLKSLESCRGVMTSAGFETSAEAMFLNKKLMVVPIRNQYEQLCNAAALQQMGIVVMPQLEHSNTVIRQWLDECPVVGIDEVADPVCIIEKILGERKKSSLRLETVASKGFAAAPQ